MQYVERAFDSVSKTWNSINPSTLSGAIDVVVVELPSGQLNCSAFHIRFGKWALLQPSLKGIDFYVNGRKTEYQMKLGEGGEAFFVFETEADVPPSLLTSPVISPQGSPSHSPRSNGMGSSDEDEMEALNLSANASGANPINQGGSAGASNMNQRSSILPEILNQSEMEGSTRDWFKDHDFQDLEELVSQLNDVKVPSTTNDKGQVLIDVTGYKPGGQNTKALEEVVHKILSHDLSQVTDDAAVDSCTNSSPPSSPRMTTVPARQASDSEPEFSSDTSEAPKSRHFVKTLRLTSDMLKSLDLQPGPNEMKFVVRYNKAEVKANIFYWDSKTPVVISDIDGTITRSDALGHVMTIIGRDWTHAGVAKLFTDIANNGYNTLYLTSRAVGQSDGTRAYLNGINQDGYSLPKGPVILSPDRTFAALRREVIMRKPEIFKMACLRDIAKLYELEADATPFYAGFGNRITDALSYRSVGIPSAKIFTINTNSEVHMELLELSGIKSSYVLISNLVDHFFPPATPLMMMRSQTLEFNSANFWRDPLPPISDEDDAASEYSNNKNNIIDYGTLGTRPTFGGVDNDDGASPNDNDDHGSEDDGEDHSDDEDSVSNMSYFMSDSDEDSFSEDASLSSANAPVPPPRPPRPQQPRR